MRCLLYVQSLLGIGHTRRIAVLANALARAGHDAHVASGNPIEPGIFLDTVTVHELPQVRAADATFSRLVDGSGNPIDDKWRGDRRAALAAIYAAVQPEILVVELFPFGRRAFAFELVPLLTVAKSDGKCRAIVCSVRDIVVAPRTEARAMECVARLHAYFDQIIVHGDPNLLPFSVSFPLADRLCDQLVYSGYMVAEPIGHRRNGHAMSERFDTVVSAGGGSVGETLLRNALEVSQDPAHARMRHLILSGPHADHTALEGWHNAISNGLVNNITFSPNRLDFIDILRESRVSISQAGYNTVCDIMQAEVRAVLVPFVGDGRETEQASRAEALARRSGVRICDEETLNPASLAGALAECLADRAPDFSDLRLDGAAQSVSLLEGIYRRRSV